MAEFSAKRVTRTYIQNVKAPPEQIFTLLCPVRQAEWLDGWEYEMVFSKSGFAEEGCVFKSRSIGEKDAVWVISKHDADSFDIEFVRVTPQRWIGKVYMELERRPGFTNVYVTYRFTALNEEGNDFIQGYTEKHFISFMKWWELSINYFLKYRKKLKKPRPRRTAGQ